MQRMAWTPLRRCLSGLVLCPGLILHLLVCRGLLLFPIPHPRSQQLTGLGFHLQSGSEELCLLTRALYTVLLCELSRSSHEFSFPRHGGTFNYSESCPFSNSPLSPFPFVSVSKQLVALGYCSSLVTQTACGRSLDIVPRCLGYLHQLGTAL